jgi:hypothetical protein
MWKSVAASALMAGLLFASTAKARTLDPLQALALVAMPLVVAEVAGLDDVPVAPLFELVSLMNAAAVPPVEFVEVVRYVPVALAVDARDPQPGLVYEVRTHYQQGVRGVQLVEVIERELREYGMPALVIDGRVPPDLLVDRIIVRDVDRVILPPIVRTHLTEVRRHPHGGPPGQLKKQLGLQTGAEVVHGTRRTDTTGRSRAVLPDGSPRTSSGRPPGTLPPGQARQAERTPGQEARPARQGGERRDPPGQARQNVPQRGGEQARPVPPGQARQQGQGEGNARAKGQQGGGPNPGQSGSPNPGKGQGKAKGRGE